LATGSPMPVRKSNVLQKKRFFHRKKSNTRSEWRGKARKYGETDVVLKGSNDADEKKGTARKNSRWEEKGRSTAGLEDQSLSGGNAKSLQKRKRGKK